MATNLRICLFDLDAADRSTLRKPFEELDGIVIVDVCSDWNRLQDHLRLGQLDAVAVNLDATAGEPPFFWIQRIAEVTSECPILGFSSDARPETIIGAMRAGCAQFVTLPVDLADLRTALERIRRARQPVPTGCQIIGVLGSAGGAGSTTLACNLSLELAHVTGRRVALIDMDLQFGDVACAFDRSPKFSLADLCREGMTIDRTSLDTALDALPCNVSLLARPESIEDSEHVHPDSVEQLLQVLSEMFPFAVLDLPRHFSLPMLAAARACTRIFIVSQLAVPFLRNATRIHRALLQADVDEHRVDLVLNRCQAEHERITPTEVEKHFGRPVFATIPNDYKHVTASRDLGYPILAAAPNSTARLAIQKLARSLAASHLGDDAVAPEPGGLFSFFRRKHHRPESAPKHPR